MELNDMIKELYILDKKNIFDREDQYIIPRYQRSYAWEDKEILQLIDDINDVDKSENYYLGSLIVSKVKDKKDTFEVVDGQQRLTTLYLLLSYLVHLKVLDEEVPSTLSFDCRTNSNFTLENIHRVLQGSLDSENEEKVEQSIRNGLKIIDYKFKTDNLLNPHEFADRLKHVILYRIEVPKHTDLNRYFEIMNTRGEQLEQHDILKAKLMGCLDEEKDREFFARVWEACSDMTGYIQMHFPPTEREKIFGYNWNQMPSDKWKNYKECIKNSSKADLGKRLNEIIDTDFKINVSDGSLEDERHVRFESIIDFPYFLLHSVRSFIKVNDVRLARSFGELLDDKKLIEDFLIVLQHGEINGKSIKDRPGGFAKKFIIHLLKSRYLFDKFIIKREFTEGNEEGEWSLKELQSSNKKAYYVNTKLNYFKEWSTSYAPRNEESKKIQSALRVSYTSPKVMHWITEVMTWLFKNEEYPKLTEVTEKIAVRATYKNFIEISNFKLGVQTPHIVFNFLDYLLWKREKNKYSDFDFEFRNSVEHFYPQHPSDGSFDAWNDVDTFGNLSIISRSVNSKFSNLSPESKMKSYSKIINKGSIKLRKMGEIIQGSSNESWINEKCKEHEEEMIYILRDYCERLE